MAKAKLTLVAATLLMAGGATYYYRDAVEPYYRDRIAPTLESVWPGNRQAARRPPQDNRVPVIAAPVTVADVPLYVTGVGTVKPENTVVVRAQVTGKIREIGFREGQDVRKGDLIASLDDALYRAQRDQAVARKAQDEAVLAHAVQELARFERLAQNASGTQQQVDSQRALVAQYSAQVQSDVAAVEAAEAQLAYTTITAPIDGRTGIRTVDAGNIVGSGDSGGIVTLSQIRPIAVLFSVPQQQLPRIVAASGESRLKVDALAEDGQTVIASGTLGVIDNQVDATTGTVRMKAEFANDDLKLWPGAFVNARLSVEVMRDVLTVPAAAVQRGPAGSFAYVVGADEKVKLAEISVVTQDDRIAVIGKGLAAGDKVVTTGFARLQDGTRVRVSTPDEAAPVAVPLDDGHKRRGSGDGGGRRQNGERRGNGAPQPPVSATPQPAAPASPAAPAATPAPSADAGPSGQPSGEHTAALPGTSQAPVPTPIATR